MGYVKDFASIHASVFYLLFQDKKMLGAIMGDPQGLTSVVRIISEQKEIFLEFFQSANCKKNFLKLFPLDEIPFPRLVHSMFFEIGRTFGVNDVDIEALFAMESEDCIDTIVHKILDPRVINDQIHSTLARPLP